MRIYWYYVFKIAQTHDMKFSAPIDGVTASDIGTFPLKEVETFIKKKSQFDTKIVFSTVIPISKEDFEYKLAELSKFKT